MKVDFFLKKYLPIFLLPLLFFGCTKTEKPGDEKKSSIIVTIPPYANFIEQIVGDTLDVKVLVPSGVNLHTYEPTPKHVESFKDAKVWFTIGEPFEKKIIKVLKQQNPELKIVNLTKNIPLLTFSDVQELNPCENTGHDHGHEGADLHIWMSPNLALRQCGIITQTLQDLFPEKKGTYRENYNDLSQKLQALSSSIHQRLEPFKGDAILVSHPAFGYFCKEFGLIQLSVECEGKAPRPRDIEQILEKADHYTVLVVFLQLGHSNKGAKLIGEKLRLPIYEVNPYARDYFTNIQQIAEKIAK